MSPEIARLHPAPAAGPLTKTTQGLGHAHEPADRHVESASEFTEQRRDLLASSAEHRQVTAGAEHVAGPSEYNTANSRIGVTTDDRFDKCTCHFEINDIAASRTIQSQSGDRTFDRK